MRGEIRGLDKKKGPDQGSMKAGYYALRVAVDQGSAHSISFQSIDQGEEFSQTAAFV